MLLLLGTLFCYHHSFCYLVIYLGLTYFCPVHCKVAYHNTERLTPSQLIPSWKRGRVVGQWLVCCSSLCFFNSNETSVVGNQRCLLRENNLLSLRACRSVTDKTIDLTACLLMSVGICLVPPHSLISHADVELDLFHFKAQWFGVI